MTEFPAASFRLAGDVGATASVEQDGKEGAFLFSGVANSGKPFEHAWLGRSVLDMGSVKVAKQLSVLLDHDSSRIAGRTTSVKPGEDGIKVEGELYRMTDAGKEAIALLQAGHPYQMSAYVPPRRVQMVDEDSEVEVNGQMLAGPLAVWKDIDLREVTLTAVGADEQTHAAALSAGEQVAVEVISNERTRDDMTTTDTKTSDTSPMTAAQLQAGHADVYREVAELGAKAERERISWILSKGAAVGAELTGKAIEEGWDKARCADAFLDAVNAKKDSRLAAMRAETADDDAKLSGLREGDDADAYSEADYKPKGADAEGDKLSAAAIEAMPMGEERFKKEWELSANKDPDWQGMTEDDYVALRKAEAREFS